MGIYDSIAQRLRTERRLRGLSQQHLAARLGVAANTVSRWETGTYKPKLDELEKLAKALQIEVADLIPRDSAPGKDASQRLAEISRGLTEQDFAEVERFIHFRRALARNNNAEDL